MIHLSRPLVATEDGVVEVVTKDELAAALAGELTQEQVDQILALIPAAPITRPEFDALTATVTALEGRPVATAWKALPLDAAYNTDPARPAQYRINNGFMEFRGTIGMKDSSLFAVDTQVTLGTLPSGERPKEWGYALIPTFDKAIPSKPGFGLFGVKSTGDIIFAPMLTAPFRGYLDTARIATWA